MKPWSSQAIGITICLVGIVLTNPFLFVGGFLFALYAE